MAIEIESGILAYMADSSGAVHVEVVLELLGGFRGRPDDDALYQQVRAAVALARGLPGPVRDSICDAALDVSEEIDSDVTRGLALVAVAEVASPSRQRDIVGAVRELDLMGRYECLCDLVPLVSGEARADAIAAALDMAGEVMAMGAPRPELSDLVPLLDDEQVERLAVLVFQWPFLLDIYLPSALLLRLAPARKRQLLDHLGWELLGLDPSGLDATILPDAVTAAEAETDATQRAMLPDPTSCSSHTRRSSRRAQSAYCGAKHAVQGFTGSLRAELRHDRSRVHVTSVHLPALNTPQFSWTRARLPRHPQPVPPIYQPEVAAAAIWWAAHHRRRELWVGASTALTILGQRLAPGVLERYLAMTGFDAQQSDRPLDARPDNLFEPVPGDHGARGIFDDAAHDRSLQLWAATRRRGLGMAATVLGTTAAARWLRGLAGTGLAGRRKATA